MRPRGVGRLVAALGLCVALYELLFVPFTSAARTGWGVALLLAVSTVALTLAFTVVYDGPRAVARLVRSRRS